MKVPSLGFIECPFLSVTCLIADSVAKSGQIQILGFEPTGAETIVIRLLAQSIADISAALTQAKEIASSLGVPALVTSLARPSDALFHLNDKPNFTNPIYDGRDEFHPSDHPESTTMKTQQAIGILETQGLTAILNATDAMLKAANVEIVGKEKIGAAYVTIIIRGDVAAVSAALEAGKFAIGDLGKLIAAHVIARPHEELTKLLP